VKAERESGLAATAVTIRCSLYGLLARHNREPAGALAVPASCRQWPRVVGGTARRADGETGRTSR